MDLELLCLLLYIQCLDLTNIYTIFLIKLTQLWKCLVRRVIGFINFKGLGRDE